MKQPLFLIGLICFAGCAKDETPSQSWESTLKIQLMQIKVDSLQQVVYALQQQLATKNSPSTGSEQVQIPISITNKTPLVAWKEVRNGATLYVKWELKVFIGAQCYLMSDGKMSSRLVGVYDSKVVLHSDDIIVVTGEASGVDEMGDVKLHAINVVNIGVN